MSTICICGGGTMGSGIAQVAASAGFSTILYDLDPAVLQKAKDTIAKNFAFLLSKGKMDAVAGEAAMNRIAFTADLHQCIADIVIEAVVEKLEVKVDLFNRLAGINGPETIFATNTSSLSVSQIAAQVQVPARVAGLHFFNPAPLMKLVEVVRGEQTSDEVIDSLLELTRTFGKEPVQCTDAPGFIVNRVARPYYIESLRLAEEGLADYATIDALMESRGFRMGPFRLMDLIGNDVNYAVSCSVYEQLQRPERLRPSYLQEEKVKKGQLGKKTGEGYYSYSNAKNG